MRIGLVNFMNAKPLDYGIRRDPHDIVEASPALLSQELLAGNLDCALISSVVCLQNSDTLAWSNKIGVCSGKRVHSVVYIKSKNTERDDVIQKLWADSASRSSVALWQCLYMRVNKILPQMESVSGKTIPSRIGKNSAGILIGDQALYFIQSELASHYNIYDMTEWWYEVNKLPFVFALWAYPIARPIPDIFFEKSLDAGIKNLDKIIAMSSYVNADSYLREALSYEIGKEETAGLESFRLALLSTKQI